MMTDDRQRGTIRGGPDGRWLEETLTGTEASHFVISIQLPLGVLKPAGPCLSAARGPFG